ncbi:MAG: hypothetical protein QOI24_10 [Acidobacteriota bacterium]|jgi:hypothetical protein|nr:hypothetical protein [Acidobacteriota bacterium]
MKPIIATAAVLFLLGASPAPSVRDTLVQLERDWAAAYLRHDAATIERILADDYVGIDGRGIVTSKHEEVEEAKGEHGGDMVLTEDTVSDMNVRVYGATAVFTGISNEKGTFKGLEFTARYRRTTVWVKKNGRWQCVSFHGSRIKEDS